MSKNQPEIAAFFDHLDCYGDYDRANPLCAKHCVIRIRCAIEQDYNTKMEMLSDLASADDLIGPIQ